MFESASLDHRSAPGPWLTHLHLLPTVLLPGRYIKYCTSVLMTLAVHDRMVEEGCGVVEKDEVENKRMIPCHRVHQGTATSLCGRLGVYNARGSGRRKTRKRKAQKPRFSLQG